MPEYVWQNMAATSLQNPLDMPLIAEAFFMEHTKFHVSTVNVAPILQIYCPDNTLEVPIG